MPEHDLPARREPLGCDPRPSETSFHSDDWGALIWVESCPPLPLVYVRPTADWIAENRRKFSRPSGLRGDR